MVAEIDKSLGTVRIAPGVLASIVNAATLNVAGVLRMGEIANPPSQSLRGRIFTSRSDEHKGVKIEINEGKVHADLYVVVSKDENMREVGRHVQDEVSKAIRHMVGMPVEHINVFIQNVE
jgi:uncharacterized alkaline shock family protein YloU